MEGLEPTDEEGSEVEVELPRDIREKIRKQNQEAKSLRERLAAREAEVLAVKFDAELVDRFSEELTAFDFEKKVAFLEKVKASSPTVAATPEQDGSAPEAETTPVEVPPGLAAVTAAPATGPASPQSMSLEDFNAIVEREGLIAATEKYGALVDLPNNPFQSGVPVQVDGQYAPKH